MKTVFVIGARGIPDVEGGVEKSAERIFPAMVQRGWRITLAALSNHITADEYRGVSLWKAPAFRFLGTDKSLYYLSAFFYALRVKPDLVHLAGLGSALMLWAYRLIGCKIVVRYGGADYLSPKWGPLGRLAFLAAEYQLRWADCVIAVSPALADRLEMRGIADNVTIIPNAVDGRKLPTTADNSIVDAPYILAVGRVTAQKNYLGLVAGFQELASSNPDLMLVLVGGMDDSAYASKLRDELSGNVLLTGQIARSRLGPLYRDAAVYINSSMHEGHSNAVLEAIGMGCPILLSDIPENRNFGLTAKHYFDAQKPESIANAIKRALVQKDQYRVDAKAYLSWDDVADQTEAAYRNLFAPDSSQKPGQCYS